MKVKFELINVNLQSGVGRFRSYTEDAKNFAEFSVRCSPLLLHAIKNKTDDRLLKRGDHYMHTIFTADTRSKDFTECPFKLVHFVPIEGSDFVENYKLELVNEPQSIKLENPIFNVITHKMEFYSNLFYKADTWRRYVQCRVAMKLSEAEQGNQIVVPMMVNK